MGRMKSPRAVFFRPPHFPRNSTALGSMAVSRSMTVAAIGLPIPKLTIVIFPAEAVCMALFFPLTSTLYFCANIST
ncbi:hypothetical protein FQZ97_979230 [compost metagenome]